VPPEEPRDGSSSDEAFDSVYDANIRGLARRHGTPVRVAARAAKILRQAGANRILDVRSGVGKFCIVGALVTEAEFVGVERRRDLVDAARATAVRYRARRVTFVQADIEAFSFQGIDGIYLHDPFFEPGGHELDGTTERSRALHARFVSATREKLAALPSPVAVVTYNGFGGRLPAPYELIGDEPAESDNLELWIKE
jgi:hypothetical protein